MTGDGDGVGEGTNGSLSLRLSFIMVIFLHDLPFCRGEEISDSTHGLKPVYAFSVNLEIQESLVLCSGTDLLTKHRLSWLY